MHIENLMFEVTRKCNMNCKHCLRGKSQCLSMSKQTIENALKDVTSIYSLQFTGGEPLLALYQIRTICETIIKNNISLGSFWLKSNGSIYSESLIKKLNYLYNNVVEETELCGFEFSFDQFHNRNIQYNIDRYIEMKECYGYEFITAPRDTAVRYLIKEGNAKNLNIVEFKNPSFKNGWVKYDDYDYDYDSMVYISANGNVMSDCDLSFENADKYTFGNVNKESLKDIIERNTHDTVCEVYVD